MANKDKRNGGKIEYQSVVQGAVVGMDKAWLVVCSIENDAKPPQKTFR